MMYAFTLSVMEHLFLRASAEHCTPADLLWKARSLSMQPIIIDSDMQELDEVIAKGLTGTGQGFDAPLASRLGTKGFGGHNPSPALLRDKIVQVNGRDLLKDSSIDDA